MSFSTNMQDVVVKLLTNYGNTCELTKVITGEYNANTGKTDDYVTYLKTYSISMDNQKLAMSMASAMNFNLAGFGEDKVMIPYTDGYEVDQTWLYDETPIKTVELIKSQDNVIAYIIELGTK